MTAKRDTSNKEQISPVVRGRSLSRSSMARRLGSARAFQISVNSSSICDQMVTHIRTFVKILKSIFNSSTPVILVAGGVAPATKITGVTEKRPHEHSQHSFLAL